MRENRRKLWVCACVCACVWMPSVILWYRSAISQLLGHSRTENVVLFDSNVNCKTVSWFLGSKSAAESLLFELQAKKNALLPKTSSQPSCRWVSSGLQCIPITLSPPQRVATSFFSTLKLMCQSEWVVKILSRHYRLISSSTKIVESLEIYEICISWMSNLCKKENKGSPLPVAVGKTLMHNCQIKKKNRSMQPWKNSKNRPNPIWSKM